MWSSLKPSEKFGAGATAGSLVGGGLWNLFGNDRDNPADSAMPFLDKIKGESERYLSPYSETGKRLSPELENHFRSLISDPSSIISKLTSGFKSSPGYNWSLDQGQRAIGNAEAAGGMLGTPEHSQKAAELASHFADQDFGNYLTRALNLQNTGLTGLAGLEEQGFGASNSLADIISQILNKKAEYSYAGTAGENTADAAGISNLFSGLGSVASLFL